MGEAESKLILVEGLPGSGKSSTSQFICDQLWRNGEQSRWYYEEEMPHPLSPSSSGDYFKDALNTWQTFTSTAIASNEITIIESRFFQDVILPLLMGDVSRSGILKHVHDIAEVCAVLNPALVYLHQPEYAAALRRICDQRGPRIERIYIARNERSAYGRRLGLQGFDGLVRSFLDGRSIMEQLYEEVEFRKLSIDNSERKWSSYYRQIGEFLSIPLRLDEAPSGQEYLSRFEGTYTYRRDEKDIEFAIRLEDGGLMMHGYGWLWPTNRLIPKEENVFYLGSWPFEMVFKQDGSGAITGATRVNPTGDWLVTGQEYPKVAEIPESVRESEALADFADLRDPAKAARCRQLAILYASLDRMEEARAEATKLLKHDPSFTVQGWGRDYARYRGQETAERDMAALRKTGLK